MNNFYSVIPTNVIFSSKLKPNEKILYGVLVSLANERGEVVETNQQIADLYLGHGHDCSPRTVSGWVNNIVRNGLFTQDIKSNNVRVLKLTHNPLLPVERPNTGRIQGYEYSGEITDVMEYYYTIFNKKPKLGSVILTNMRNHFKNGYTVLDFQKVIAVKSVDPFFIENPQYQLPSTLFRPANFIKYLNEYNAKVVDETQTPEGQPVITKEKF